MAFGIGLPNCQAELKKEARSNDFKLLNQSFSRGRICGRCYLWSFLSKPFLLLNFYTLPRWIAEDAGEAALVEDLGEGEVPVEEAVLAGEGWPKSSSWVWRRWPSMGCAICDGGFEIGESASSLAG